MTTGANIAKQRLSDLDSIFDTQDLSIFCTGGKVVDKRNYKLIAANLFDALRALLEDVILSQDEIVKIDLDESIAKAGLIIDQYDDIF